MTDKITIDAKDFFDAVKMVNQVIEPRNTIPVLGLIRLKCGPANMKISGTNLDAEITTNVATNGAGGFDLMVSPKSILRFLTAVTGVVEISTEVKSHTTTLIFKNERDEMQFDCDIGVEDMPVMKKRKIDAAATIPEAELHRILKRVSTCISTEITRYYLNGIYFHAVDGALNLVATEGHRLMLQATDFEWHGEGFILPSQIAKILIKAADKRGNGSVTISLCEGGQHIMITTKHFVLFSKVIDGSFPDYTRVIPAPSDTIGVCLSVKDLRKFKGCRTAISVDPDAGMITQQDRDHGTILKVGVEIGHGESFGLNHSYISLLLGELGTSMISGSGVTDPFRVICDDKQTTCVIMPMRIYF